MQNQNVNPFILLCKNSQNKNIDSNFVQTLQALIFLNSENVATLINEKYQESFTINADSQTSNSPWFKKKIELKEMAPMESHSYSDAFSLKDSLSNILASRKSTSYGEYNKYGEPYQVIENFHIGEFLLDKLSENLRRLYSAHRKGGKLPKELGSNISDLNEQQKSIYQSLEIISPYVKFDSQSRIFNKIFFGKVRYCSNAQAFFYMSLHEHLLTENENKHKEILINHFNTSDISSFMVSDLLQLSYPKNKQSFVKDMIKNLPDDLFESMASRLKDNSISQGSFMVDVFLHCSQNNIEMSKEKKEILFNLIMHNNGFLHKQPANMAKIYVSEIKDYISDIDLSKTQQRSINPMEVHKNCVTDMALMLAKHLTDPNLFWASLQSNIEPSQQLAIMNKYDFSNQDVMFKISQRIASSGSRKNELMQKFVSLVGDQLTNQTLSQILASDFSFIEIIKPLYMTRKLDHDLPVKENQNQPNSHRKYKI